MFQSASQLGQDFFVYKILKEKKDGTYLDLGCGDCIDDFRRTKCLGSNTIRLYELRWRGIGADKNTAFKWGWDHIRKAPFIEGDLTTVDWEKIIENYPILNSVVDYLSFDVSDSTYKVFNNFPWDRVRFRVITIDHSSFRTGNFVRDHIRKILEEKGYTLLCRDVTLNINGKFYPTEDWWVDMTKIDREYALRFMCENKEGANIYRLDSGVSSMSQAGQDLFTYRVLHDKKNGTYIDIGCNDCMVHGNNTLTLSEKGWKGIGIELDDTYRELWENSRGKGFIQGDVTVLDWEKVIKEYPFTSQVVDYISFDVDDATLLAVNHFPWDKIRARVITIEHDSYHRGDGLKNYIRNVLKKSGYYLLCPDVMIEPNLPYEDWWIDPNEVDLQHALKFQSRNELGVEIARKNFPLTLPVSTGEALDKYSILQLKKERIVDPEKVSHIQAEISALSPVLSGHVQTYKEIYGSLLSVNREIWDMSESIRKMDKKSLIYTETVSKIMDKNEQRYSLKALLNDKTNSVLKEQKSYSKKPLVYISGGKLGDFIHSLYVIMCMYSTTGKKGILYISDNFNCDIFPKGAVQVHKELENLLLSQEYIEDFLVDNPSSRPPEFINLGSWRRSPMLYLTNWCNLLSQVYQIPELPKPWLSINSPPNDKIGIHCRIPSPGREATAFPWGEIVRKNSCVFITCDKAEYDAFPYKDKVALKLCDSLGSMVEEINSVKIFVANQSAPLAIATALHKPILADLLRGRLDSSHYKEEYKNNPNFFWIWENQGRVSGIEKFMVL